MEFRKWLETTGFIFGSMPDPAIETGPKAGNEITATTVISKSELPPTKKNQRKLGIKT